MSVAERRSQLIYLTADVVAGPDAVFCDPLVADRANFPPAGAGLRPQATHNGDSGHDARSNGESDGA